jgi:hypothetical protein
MDANEHMETLPPYALPSAPPSSICIWRKEHMGLGFPVVHMEAGAYGFRVSCCLQQEGGALGRASICTPWHRAQVKRPEMDVKET